MGSTTLLEREMYVSNLEEPPLQQELTYGRSYRVLNENTESSPIKQKHSPVNVPFKLCREAQERRKSKKPRLCKCSIRSFYTKQDDTPDTSLLGRSVLTQDQYMELLSKPGHVSAPRKKHPKRKINICCKCKVEPCPPRIIQMSIPKKRRVLANWQDYEHLLPAEMLLRFDQILKSGNNLEPMEARYYFKQLQKQKRKEIRKRKRLCKKIKEAKKRGERMWIKKETEALAEAIMCFIKHEPLFMLNFHQMMTSNELLRYLCSQNVIKIRDRNTKCVYKKTVIEISDKLIKWMDTMNFFVDVQPLDSKEKLVLEIPSLESLLEEETEEEEGEEEELDKKKHKKLAEEEEEQIGILYEEYEGVPSRMEELMAKKILDKMDKFDEELEGEGLFDFFDEDTLEKLIQILSESPADLLLEEIDSENIPGVTYGDILEKLKLIRDGNLLEAKRDQLFLEERMVEWAKNNDPERVDDKVLDKIHETSTILLEWFKNAGLSDFRKDMEKGPRAAYETDEYGEELVPVEEIFEKTTDKGKAAAATPVIMEEREESGEDLRGQEFGGFAGGEFGEGLGEDEYGAGVRDDRLVEGAPIGAVAEGEEFGEDTGGEMGREGRQGFGEGEEGGERLGLGGEGENFELGEGEEYEPGEREGFGRREKEFEEREGLGLEEGEGFGLGGREGEDFGLGEREGEDFGFGEREGEDFGFGEREGEDFGLGARGEGLEGEAIGLEGEGLELEEGSEFEEEGFELGEAFELGEGEEEAISKLADELERLDSLLGIIRGHKPSRLFEHQPGTICCLSLKIWAVWLLEIANNAHNWTKWIGDIIKQVRYYVSVIRGDVLLPNGEKKVFYKEEWRRFVKDTEEKIIAWRQYSSHVKDLSLEIIENFHGKPVECCPKCLQDHLIKNVVTAHETLQALTEAINCANYWQRCLDKIVEQTSKITEVDMTETEPTETTSLKSEESYTIEIEELSGMPQIVGSEASYESVYELEELICSPKSTDSDYEILEETLRKGGPVLFHELEELSAPEKSQTAVKHEPKKNAKPQKPNLKKKR